MEQHICSGDGRWGAAHPPNGGGGQWARRDYEARPRRGAAREQRLGAMARRTSSGGNQRTWCAQVLAELRPSFFPVKLPSPPVRSTKACIEGASTSSSALPGSTMLGAPYQLGRAVVGTATVDDGRSGVRAGLQVR